MAGCRPSSPVTLGSDRSNAPSAAAIAPDAGASGGELVSITVSAAASLQEVLEAISPPFEQAHPDIQVSYNFAASGKLQQQIEQGAPADVFFSAAAQQMDALAEKDLIVPDSRRDLLTNRLVLVAATPSELAIGEFGQLATTPFERLAVGEFRTVPAGQYAQEVFTGLDLLAFLQDKLVFGSSVRSVLAAVESGNADLGVVYATDAAKSDQVKVLATAPTESHRPIAYPIAVVQGSPHPEAAEVYIDFLTTDAAKTSFQDFGFGVVD